MAQLRVLIELCKKMKLSDEDTMVILHAVVRDENYAKEAKELIQCYDKMSKDSNSEELLKKLKEMLKNIRFKQIQDKFREIREQQIKEKAKTEKEKEKNSDGGR